MKKSNILMIILSFITGLVVCGVAMLSIMIYRDYQADKDNTNSQVNLQSTSSDYAKQNIEEKNNQADLQQNEEPNVTVEENKVEDTNVDTTPAANTVENTSTVQQPKQSVNSTSTASSQSKSNSTSSNTNSSSNTTKSTNTNVNTTKPANTTNQTAKQNNNSSGYYIVNKNSKIFHIPSCHSVKQMKESNKIVFYGSRSEAISNKYKPCQNCNP